MTSDKDRSNRGGGLAMAGLGLLMLACCAGPALITGGALGVLGDAVHSPWLLAAGGLAVAAAVGYILYRRARQRCGQATSDCCPPETANTTPGHQADPRAH